MNKGKYIKYPSIPYLAAALDILSNEVELFEKLDGGNCQIRKIQGRIVPGSRSNYLEGNKVNKVWWFEDFVRWVGNKTKQDLYGLDSNFVIFGEWLALHNIKYSFENMGQFYFIDMYDIERKRFLEYEQGKDYLKMLGIELNTIRCLGKGKFHRAELDRRLGEKSDYREGCKEGIVIKDYQRQRFAKLLHPEFSEVSYNRRLPAIDRYVTKKRLEKTQQAMKEEGKDISRKNLADRIKKDVLTDQGVALSEKQIEKRFKTLDV
jgi:hypothetical protein